MPSLFDRHTRQWVTPFFSISGIRYSYPPSFRSSNQPIKPDKWLFFRVSKRYKPTKQLAMRVFNILVPLFGLVAISSATLAPAQRQVLVTYPADTPSSILQEAKEVIVAAVSAHGTGIKVTDR